MSSTAIFVLLATILASAFIKSKFPNSRRALTIAALLLFAVYVGLLTTVWIISDLGFKSMSIPKGICIICAIVGLCAATMLLEYIYEKLRIRVLVVAIAAALFLGSYLSGVVSKARIWSEAYFTSFAYIADIDPRYNDDAYLDEFIFHEDGTVTFFGETYEPEKYQMLTMHLVRCS